MLWVSPGFSTQSDGSRMRNLSRQWKSGSLLWALMLPQSCLLLFDLPSFWSSWSSWNSERSNESWGGWCWTNEEDCSTHHMWNYLWSLCLRVDVWCRGIQINPIKQPIQSNSVGSWHVSHLNHGFIVSETNNIAPNREDLTLDETWSTLFRSRLTCLVGCRFFMWSMVLRDKLPCDFWPLDLLIWFGEEWNTSITKSQRSSAWIPSMRKPASREMISSSVELCETEVCFLHIQLTGTNV